MAVTSVSKEKAMENETQTKENAAILTNCDECRGLTAQIPETLYFGTLKVDLTCVEVSERFIAFGSDVGALFLFNRALGKFAKPLRTKVEEVVNVVRIQSGEADVLAAGHKSGTIAVLRLPSSVPGANRKMDQHSLDEIHKGKEVVCLDWSPDGSKLFSADTSGIVIMTMVDFENRVFHSTFVCTEPSPIVQISYSLSRLAVSSEERSIVVDLANECSVQQIGSSSRSSKGNYGIITLAHDSTLMVVTSRPNCRLWLANAITGHVDKTIIYAQQMKTAPSISLPDSLKSTAEQPASEQPCTVELGCLQKLSNELLVASDSRTISLVDVSRAKVIIKASIPTDQLKVRSVCVDTSHGQSTIFVLLDKRHLIRLSDQPSPVEFVNVPHAGMAASILSGSFLPTKTSAILSKLKPPPIPRAKMDALPFGTTFGLESLFGSQKDNFLKANTSSADMRKSSVENSIANLNEQLQIADSDSSSTTADKLSDDGQEQIARVGWRENVADAVTALVDHVGGALADVQTGAFVADDFQQISSSPNTTIPTSPLQMTNDDQVVVTRQTRLKRKQKNGKSRESSAVRSRSSARNSGCYSPKPDQVDNESETEAESNFYAEATRAALEKMLDEQLVLPAPIEESADDHEQLPEIEMASEEKCDQVVHNDVGTSEDQVDEGEITLSPPNPKLIQSQYEYDAYQVLLEDNSRNIETRDQFNPEPGSGEYVIDEDLFDTSHPFSNAPRAENLDIWSPVKMAYPIVSVASTDQYMVVSDSRKKIHYARLHSHELKWHAVVETADQVAVSGTGKLVWRITDKKAYALQRPEKQAPRGHKWVEAARNDIRAVALSSSAAWYLRSEGKVCVQLNLTPDRPCYRVQSADSDWTLVAIAASDSAVWALRDDGSLLVRAGLKEDPIGVDWIHVSPDGPSPFVSISLFEHVGWAVDSNGDVWFIKGVDFHTPFGASGRWYQVASPTMTVAAAKVTSYRPLPSVAATKSGIYLSAGTTLYAARGAVCGHRWKRSLPKKLAACDNFTQVTVEGLYEVTCDAIYLLRGNAEIFVHRLQERNLVSLPPLPGSSSNINCIASNLGVLWALDSSGKLYLRTGIDTKMAPTGVEWVAVELSQFESEKIIHLACSFEAVWTVTDKGSVKMCIGREQIHAAWVPVDLPEQLSSEEKINKVYAGADGALVWIQSVSGRVWARAGIIDVLPIGDSWIEVCGLSCRDVALGSSVVWSVNGCGQLYRRHGIAPDNPAGNYWKPVPAILSFISVTPNNRLWALDIRGRLVRHQVEIYRPAASTNDADIRADIDPDFEVI